MLDYAEGDGKLKAVVDEAAVFEASIGAIPFGYSCYVRHIRSLYLGANCYVFKM